MPVVEEPTYARQMLRPFWRLLRRYPQIPSELLDQAEATAPERMPVAKAQELLSATVAMTGDEDLGLRAAAEAEVGAFDVLEYVAFSAPNWRAALETTFRYSHLMNEAAAFRLEIHGSSAHMILHSTVPLTRAGVDFQSAAFHHVVKRWLAPTVPELEVWFAHDEPADTTQYRKTFEGSKLRFAAPWNGFVYDAARLDTPLPSHAPALFSALREHADAQLKALTPETELPEQVRAHIESMLHEGRSGAELVAQRLHMSRRTLTRRLEHHGTSYRELLELVRKRAATHYLSTTEHSVEDIAFMLGFSESAPFVRAFKRWTGSAPMSYRRQHRA